MRLKPVVASIVLLGLSGTAFAATQSNVAMQNQLNSMQVQLNQLEKSINQNNGGTTTGGGTALQKRLASCPNWYDSITVSGLLNVDGILASRDRNVVRNPGTHVWSNRSASDLALDNADLFIDARVNSWTKAHIGINYQDNNNNYNYDNPKSLNVTLSNESLIIKPVMGSLIDEAYVTFGDFCRNPFYFRVGKQYVNFGNYDRFATIPTFTQLLSQTNETAATLGFVSNGFYGSVYGFRGATSVSDNSPQVRSKNVNNWGANLGWSMKSRNSSVNLQAGYLNGMQDVDYVNVTNGFFPVFPVQGYERPVNAMSLDASGSYRMFDAYAHFVSAIDHFSTNEIRAQLDNSQNDGAQPSALTVGGGITTNVMNHKTRFGLDYQYSWDAVFVGLYGIPQARMEGTIDMNINKNVVVGLYLDHDQDYNVNQGGTGKAATTGVLHLGVMFA